MAYELFADSFDSFNGTFSYVRWNAEGTGVVLNASKGRRGTYAINPNTNGGISRFITPSTCCVTGFYLDFTNTSVYSFYFWMDSDATRVTTLEINNTRKIIVTCNGLTYTSTNSITDGGKNYIEFGIKISDTVGSLEVKVNGSSIGWINAENIDTKGAYSTTNKIALYAQLGVATYIDDLYTTYGDELKWLGDVCVDALTLTGNDTRQDFVPDTGNAWERLNQTAGNVKSNIVGSESYFELANTTSTYTINSIEGIIINATAKKDGANTRAFAITANSNNVVFTGNTNYLGESYVEYRTPLVLNPSGNTTWTKEDINNLKVGIKLVE